jgi:hypothetical protein
VSIQSDGKIVALSTWQYGDHWAVTRFNTDGSLDTSFGDEGSVIADFGAASAGYRAAIDGDGRITVASLLRTARLRRR